MLVISLKYTAVPHSILCLVVLMCVATMHRLNYSGQESKNQTLKTKQNNNNKIAVYDSDVPVTLTGRQTWHKLLDPKQS